MKKKQTDLPSPPVIRVAPLGELKAYTVYEHELDALARGSSASLFLNFALSLLSVCLTLVVTLLTTTISSDRLFLVFVTSATVTAIAGALLMVLWWKEHQGSKTLIMEIKSRMPPLPTIQVAVSDEGKAVDSATVEKRD